MDHISIIPETLFRLGGLPVTNTLLTSWAVVVLLSIFAIALRFKTKNIPGKIQNLSEIFVENFLGFLETIGGNPETARRFFPFVATLFLFILSANWFGILPGIGSVGFFAPEGEHFTALFRSVNSDLNMTLALAVMTVVLSHLLGLIYVGMRHHVGKFLNFKSPMRLFTGALEIIGEVSKIISLSFRLFGNVFAGEVLLVIISFLVPYIVPIPFLGLELFVGLIQALIFAVLAMLALSTMTKLEGH